MKKNLVNKFLLWVALLPASLYRRMGVDLPHLKAILLTKLTIDDRRATGLYKAGHQSDQGVSLATLITMAVSLVMGLILLFVFVLPDDLTRMTFYFSSLSLMLALLLITDFSHILIDPKDNEIILPKPVSPTTFIVARLLHILIHLAKIIIPLSFPGLLAIGISRGLWGSVIFIPAMASLTIITFALVNAAYLMIIRFFSVEKLNSIITTFQIVFTVIVYGAFQLLPRIMDQELLIQLDVARHAWFWLFPSFWMAAGWTFFYTLSTDPVLMTGAVLSIAIPILSIWIVIKYLAPAFLRKLSMMNTGSTSAGQSQKIKMKPHMSGSPFLSQISRWVTSPGAEREALRFTWHMTDRYRAFKMKVFPQIGYLIVIFAIFFIGKIRKIDLSNLREETDTLRFPILLAIYYGCFIYFGAMHELPFHEKFRSAWIYFTTPLRKPGVVIRGAIKACLLKFFFPLILLVTVVFLFLFGVSILPNLLFGFGNVFLICMLYSWFIMDKLPFSVSSKNRSDGEMTFRNFFMLIALPFVAIPHYFLFHFPWILGIISIFTLTASLFILQRTRNIGWSYMKQSADV